MALDLKITLKAITSGLKSGLKSAEGAVQSFSRKIKNIDGSAGFSKTKLAVDKLKLSVGAAAGNIAQLNTRVKEATTAGGALGGALRLISGITIVNWFKEAATGAQSLYEGFKVITGSSTKAREELDYVRRTASQLGLPLKEAGKAYLSLAAAAKGTALEGEASRKIFEAVSLAMGKLGRSSADTEGALLAIQQMISKGKVSAEELRGQLGERLPGAFQAAARAIGVTTQELDDMLKAGELTAEELLPKLTVELNKLYNDGKRIETFSASWNRLKNSISTAFSAVNESTGAMNLLGKAMEAVGSGISILSVGFVTLIEKIKGATQMVKAFFDAATSRDTSIADALQKTRKAWIESEEAIRKAADTAFNADSNLSKLGTTTQDTGIKVIQLGNAASSAKSDLNSLSDSTKDLKDASNTTGDETVKLAENVNELAKQYREGKIDADAFLAGVKKHSSIADDVSRGYKRASGAAAGYGQAVQNSEQQAAAARAKGLSGFANFWKRVYDTYHGISAAAGAAYDSLFEKFKRMGVAAKDYHYVLKTTHDFLEKLDVRIKDWAKGAQGYGESLRGVIANATRAIGNMKVLDAQKLNQLRSQIGAARAALRGLNDDARATLSSIRQELAELQGDVLGAEQLRYQQRREALQSQLQNLIRQGATEGAADIRAALAALQTAHSIRMQQLRAEQAEQGNSTTPGAAPLPPQRNNWGEGLTNNLVEVRFSTGAGLGTSGFFPQDGVGDFLQVLQDAGATTE
ncbi:MAG: tape measure protein [Candidatus Thiodiazotropha endolucinida]|nr:tape measure protein [Candidatus Thiodiazotropha taylori]MCW4315675.1 tape measure protein [Candidatus Thiodiazotropha taylori]